MGEPTPQTISEIREASLHREAEKWSKGADEIMFRLLTDTNPDPWPQPWTHNDGRSYQDSLDQGHERFDACRDRDGKTFPLLPHQKHRQDLLKGGAG